ncbi:hypothetical protein KC678_01230 [Candidatus Dojkabacteria bacterium]|uniref:Uncharacterized protein n=1 Tax=Candidatus Dojkabacteria bacterium TaxID=2099670 RepID=A0A955I8H6_9BACT|nr:hypothetical protein [Candidatus Dojkabacteria bacterium]
MIINSKKFCLLIRVGIIGLVLVLTLESQLDLINNSNRKVLDADVSNSYPDNFSDINAPDPNATTQITYYVNNSHSNANDNNSGLTPDQPLKTIQKGVSKALITS